MIIDTKNKKLIYNFGEKVFKLSNTEIRVILLLSDNEKHSQKELIKFSKTKSKMIGVIIHRLKRKIPQLTIKTYTGIGYQLFTRIFFI